MTLPIWDTRRFDTYLVDSWIVHENWQIVLSERLSCKVGLQYYNQKGFYVTIKQILYITVIL